MIMHIKVFCESATIKDYDDILENVKQLSFPKTSHLKNKDFFSRKLLPLWKKKNLPPEKITLWSADRYVKDTGTRPTTCKNTDKMSELRYLKVHIAKVQAPQKWGLPPESTTPARQLLDHGKGGGISK